MRYIGSWDYAWLVDDLKIVEQPAYDLRSLAPFVAGTNNIGLEYGKFINWIYWNCSYSEINFVTTMIYLVAMEMDNPFGDDGKLF